MSTPRTADDHNREVGRTETQDFLIDHPPCVICGRPAPKPMAVMCDACVGNARSPEGTVRRLRALLRRCEWVHVEDEGQWYYCPICEGVDHKHEPYCELAAEIGEDG